MISTGYIHACDDLWFIESAYQENMSFIGSIFDDLTIRSMQRNTMKDLGVYTESQDECFTESVADAVRKVGEKVIEIVERIKQFVKDVIGKIRGAKIKHKALGKDMDALEKSNPELAEKVKVAVASGDIDFATMRGISDYYKEIDKIMADIEKNKVDPKSLRGRLDAAKKKLNENQETVKSIAAILGLATAATGLYWGYRKYQQSKATFEADTEKQSMLLEKKADHIKRELDRLNSLPEDKRPATKIGYLATVCAEVDRTGEIEITKRTRFIEKFGMKFDNACKAVLKKAGKTSSYSDKKKAELTAESKRLDSVRSNRERVMNNSAESIERGKTTKYMKDKRDADLDKARSEKTKAEREAELASARTANEHKKHEQMDELHVKQVARVNEETAKFTAEKNAANARAEATRKKSEQDALTAAEARNKLRSETNHNNAKADKESAQAGFFRKKAETEKRQADSVTSKAKSDKITTRLYQDKIVNDGYASLMKGDKYAKEADKAAADADYTRKKMEHFGENYDSNYDKRRGPYRDKKNSKK